jgi:hypothetical protein
MAAGRSEVCWMFSALAPLLFLALNPSLPEAARLHAARVDAEHLIPQGKVLHFRWRTRMEVDLFKRPKDAPPSPPGELEEFIGPSFHRFIYRVNDIHYPVLILDDTDEASFIQNSSGLIEPVVGVNRAVAVTWSIIVSERWLSGDSATVTAVSQTPESTTLRVMAVGGSSALVVVNRDGDLTEVRMPAESPRWLMTFEDFQPDGAAIRPRTMTVKRDSGAPITYVLMSREVISDPHLAPLTPGVDWSWPAGVDRVTLPLYGWPTVEVDVGGHPGLFLLDTGTTLTVVDTSFAKSLHLQESKPIETFDAGEVPSQSLTQVPKLCFRGACAESHVVATASLGSSLDIDFPGVVGILGTDVLSRVVVSIDFGAAQVAFAKNAHWSPPADDVPVATQMIKSRWYITATVAGQEGNYLVDTGDEAIVTLAHRPDQAGMVSASERSFSRQSEMLGTTFSEWPTWGAITVGPFQWKHALLAVIDPTTVKGEDHYSVANGDVGIGFLKHFRVTLDGQAGRVWLKQIAAFGAHEHDCAFGLSLRMSDGWLTVREAAPGGPAARAGVRAGDRILSVNELSTQSVDGFAAFPNCVIGDPVTLRLRRGDRTKTVVLKPVAIP